MSLPGFAARNVSEDSLKCPPDDITASDSVSDFGIVRSSSIISSGKNSTTSVEGMADTYVKEIRIKPRGVLEIALIKSMLKGNTISRTIPFMKKLA